MAANGGIKGKLNKPSHGGNVITTMKSSGNFVTQQGTTAQSYSLTQNCVTVGGCSVSVTQGN